MVFPAAADYEPYTVIVKMRQRLDGPCRKLMHPHFQEKLENQKVKDGWLPDQAAKAGITARA